MSGDQVDLKVASTDSVSRAATALGSSAENNGVDGRHVRGRVSHAGRDAAGLLRALEHTGIELDSIEVHRPTLDDIFFTVTRRSHRDTETNAD